MEKKRPKGLREKGLVVIAIRPETRARLHTLTAPGVTYDDVLRRLLDAREGA